MIRAALAILCVVALVGCSAGPGGSKSSTAKERSVKAGITEKGPVTLTVWDINTGDKTFDRLNRHFEQLHPNVTIKRVTKGFNDYYATLKLALSGPTPPDVVQGGQGWSTGGDGVLVSAGLIDPLDNWAQAYGWLKRGYPSLREMEFSPDGKHWGTGRLYGIAHYAAPVGFFYNKAKLRKLGLPVPGSLSQLESDLAAAKRAGEVPIEFGDADKWPGEQEYGMIQNFLASPKQINDWIYGAKGARFDTATNVKAAAMLQDWARKGYFTPGFNGISYDDSTAAYQKGTGVFLFSGSWLTANYGNTTTLGFTVIPPTPGAKPVAISTQGEPWHIASKSKHKDVAAAYIDYITGPYAENVFLRQDNQIPAIPLRATNVGTPLFRQANDVYHTLARDKTNVAYLSWATPDMDNVMGGAVQELMAAKITPKQFVQTVQADYAKFERTHGQR